MATKTPGKKFQAGQRLAHLFPIHHETFKRKERETEKVANRVVAESFENSRKVSLSQRHCVNFIGCFFINVFITLGTS